MRAPRGAGEERGEASTSPSRSRSHRRSSARPPPPRSNVNAVDSPRLGRSSPDGARSSSPAALGFRKLWAGGGPPLSSPLQQHARRAGEGGPARREEGRVAPGGPACVSAAGAAWRAAGGGRGPSLSRRPGPCGAAAGEPREPSGWPRARAAPGGPRRSRRGLLPPLSWYTHPRPRSRGASIRPPPLRSALRSPYDASSGRRPRGRVRRGRRPGPRRQGTGGPARRPDGPSATNPRRAPTWPPVGTPHAGAPSRPYPWGKGAGVRPRPTFTLNRTPAPTGSEAGAGGKPRGAPLTPTHTTKLQSLLH